VQKNTSNDFVLLVASAGVQPPASHVIKISDAEATLTVKYGDFATTLQKVITALEEV
jgi:dipeptidyl-peptidase-3